MILCDPIRIYLPITGYDIIINAIVFDKNDPKLLDFEFDIKLDDGVYLNNNTLHKIQKEVGDILLDKLRSHVE